MLYCCSVLLYAVFRVGGWIGGGGGGGVIGKGDLRPPSPVICKSKARSSQSTPAIRV